MIMSYLHTFTLRPVAESYFRYPYFNLLKVFFHHRDFFGSVACN